MSNGTLAAWWVALGDRAALIAAELDTPGISRNMAAPAITPLAQGGGDQNGTQALIFFGQAGTTGQRIAMPRAGAGNYTGVV